MSDMLPVRNNSLSVRSIGPIAEGGPKVTILPGQVAMCPVDLLKAMEGNKAFEADVIEGRIGIGVVPPPEPLKAPEAPAGTPEGEPPVNPDALLNS